LGCVFKISKGWGWYGLGFGKGGSGAGGATWWCSQSQLEFWWWLGACDAVTWLILLQAGCAIAQWAVVSGSYDLSQTTCTGLSCGSALDGVQAALPAAAATAD
jgi:hypothetical protein